jgi:YVTN family beta-propeller protein
MMQSEIRLSKIMIFFIFNVIVFIFIFFSLNNKTFADIHEQTLSGITNPNPQNQISDIQVGIYPKNILSADNKLFVTNFYDNTVSVINATDYTKIKDIPVGKGPRGIAFDYYKHEAYVANFGSNTT